jgi:hypothetical protein
MFGVEEFILPRLILGESEHPSSKNKEHSNGPKIQIAVFLETAQSILIVFQ